MSSYMAHLYCENDLFFICAGRNEMKNQRERERYALNRKDILNRQCQTHEHYKNNTTLLDGINIVSSTPSTGKSVVTQVHNIASADGVVPSPMHFHGVILDNNENTDHGDESDWLHRNDAYQMQTTSRRVGLTQLPGVENPRLSRDASSAIPECTFQNQGLFIK